MKQLIEITDEDVIQCQTILNLHQIPSLDYTKRIIARIFTDGWVIERASGKQIIGVYNYLKDKYELPF